jgi:hypothetical protein
MPEYTLSQEHIKYHHFIRSLNDTAILRLIETRPSAPHGADEKAIDLHFGMALDD